MDDSTIDVDAWCRRLFAADLSAHAKLIGVWFAVFRTPLRECVYGCVVGSGNTECGSRNGQCACISYSEIADAVGASCTTVRRAVCQLVEGGWLLRRVMPSDCRAHGDAYYVAERRAEA